MLPYRDSPTKFGGVVRIMPNGTVVVIKRDFGLTDEPECSEAAHRQMYKWMCEQMGVPFDPSLFVTT
ncbi:MAG: hypothetical protein E6R03_10210 [Hyphomicrobiaceae bacterium]|nr:MAG: hypothetical protein E6R03_10210 [Hyphomicrobiaceae bacterium]